MSIQEMILNGLSNIQNDGDLLGVIQDVMNSNGVRDSRWNPHIDIIDTQNNLYVYAEIPGVSESSISVDFFNNKVSISGEKIKRYSNPAIKHEITYGKFVRCITLPISVTNQGNVIVKYTNGVLVLSIDKKKEEQNKFSIGINSSTDAESSNSSVDE